MARCVDDRGRPWQADARSFDRAVGETGRDPATVFGLPRVLGSRGTFVFLVYLPAGLAYLGMLWASAGQLVEWMRWAMLVAFFALAMAIERALSRSRSSNAQRRAGLALGLCPACGYELTRLAPEADGCHVCPECGSAWKLDGSTFHPPL